MAYNKETVREIGLSIEHNFDEETRRNISNHAIGRAYCHVDGGLVKSYPEESVIWLLQFDPRARHPLPNAGNNLYYQKNSKIGGAITEKLYGKTDFTHPYGFRGGGKIKNKVNLDIHNCETYETDYSGITNLKLYNELYKGKTFSTLEQLLHDRECIKQELEKERAKAEEDKRMEAQRKAAAEKAKKEREEAERKAREAEERLKAVEEARRLEAERKAEEARKAAEEARLREEAAKKEQEAAKKRKEHIAELEDAKAKADEFVMRANRQVRQDVSLRSQHILDPRQEKVKRSHIFDGIPMVIDGGPGTGKTTTMIQRIKFLISDQVLREYEAPLTEAQIQKLTDPRTISNNWIFFSPTNLLLHFLRQNMANEELYSGEGNSVTLAGINGRLMLDYRLTSPDKGIPFKLLTRIGDGEEVMINEPQEVVSSFEKFCIKEITKKMITAYQLSTANYSWHSTALPIKAHCKRADNIKDMDALMRLVNSLEDTYKKDITDIETKLSNEVKNVAILIQEKVENDESMVKSLSELFLSWKEDSYVEIDVDDEDDTEDEEEETIESQNIDFKPELFRNLKPLVRKLGLQRNDSKIKLSKRQKEIHDIIKTYSDEINIDRVADLVWFTRNYASLCKGLANAVLNPITRLYKAYRKQMLENQPSYYNKKLLEKVIKKGNKQLHPDELHLLVGFINRQLLGIYKKSRKRFDALNKNKYMVAYNQHVKYVIGIDEATDYSWLDYYLITSLCHYEFCSLTLCGDSMQALTENGITDWDELQKELIPKLQVEELTVSYRQSATLVETARQMYLDSKGKEASYHSDKTNEFGTDAKPLAFISDDEDEKVSWMAHRIVEVFKNFGNKVPTIAVFVGDEENIKELEEALRDQDCLNSITIADCSDGRTCPQTKCVRIFRMREVKGMEFEVTFFYNIDKALDGASTDLMRRYLYVGISRAATHLAAIFDQEEGNEEILKYFDCKERNWRM